MRTWQKLKNNPDLFERYFVKEYIIKTCRKFFEDRNYHELESPILSPALPQERYLDILSTEITFEDKNSRKLHLIPSTETFNKKILVAGLGNHFVISKVFRGLEQISPNHSPEFTMLEWYELDNSYIELMNSTEDLVVKIIKNLKRNSNLEQYQRLKDNYEIIYNNNIINFKKGWQRFSVRELLIQHAGVNLENIQSIVNIINFAKLKNLSVNPEMDWQSIFEIIFSDLIEPNLDWSTPIFIYDFPRILCPLTKPKLGDSLVCEKVELYIAGKEIGNGYTELLDWQEQERRFLEEQKARKDLGRPEVNFDYDLIEALKEGMSAVAGIGIGLDRLAMILADAKNISDINYFPAGEWE